MMYALGHFQNVLKYTIFVKEIRSYSIQRVSDLVVKIVYSLSDYFSGK